jgi:predicted permease
MIEASRVQLGFDPNHVAFASTDPIRQGYDPKVAANLLAPLADALRVQPGVSSAALASATPLQVGLGTTITVEGQPQNEIVQLVMVSPEYFETLGIPLLNGRDFSLGDTATSSGVAVVNAFAARKYWPDQEPIGKYITNVGPRNQTFELVGVVDNIAPAELGGRLRPLIYLPIAQAYLMFPFQPDINLLARTSGDPRTLVPLIRTSVARINPYLPVFRIRTMRDQVMLMQGEQRFLARVLLLFAALATSLCAAGIYGVVSFTTAASRREFGIRMALGAQTRSVLWMVLRRGMVLTSLGLIIGLTTAAGLSRLVTSYLYGVSPTDSLTFLLVALLALSVTSAACYFPARRATRVDPLQALRAE